MAKHNITDTTIPNLNAIGIKIVNKKELQCINIIWIPLQSKGKHISIVMTCELKSLYDTSLKIDVKKTHQGRF